LANDLAAICIDVWKTYTTSIGQVEALVGIDAEFAAGAMTAVVGPSGSGKSTLLKLLAGLDGATHGDVVVQGRHLVGVGQRRLRHVRRHSMTYVFQRPADNFVPHLTLAEHASLLQGRQALKGARGREVFQQFGIGHKLGDLPQALSGGEQARAAFALALLRGTPLILADEPTAELDERSSHELLSAVRLHADRGVAFVVATHDRSVTDISDEVVVLERGRRITDGGGPLRPLSGRPLAPRATRKVVAVTHGISKSYRRGDEIVHAVSEVSLELHAAELIALVGRSGSGKSTLFNLLAGWQQPDAGAVSYSVNGVTEADPAQLGWDTLAVLPQKFGLMEELSVRGNVEYPARLAGVLSDRREWIESLIADLELGEFADRLPHEISVGQQQRTALARALALAPAVLLADEPTAHQDVRLRTSILTLLRDVAETGTCCVVATHEEQIRELADATWRMVEGTLALDPSPPVGEITAMDPDRRRGLARDIRGPG
jgi:putative ABC transport system ATP-binding protein